MNNNLETATLGGGCFWCLEAIYKELKGVLSVESGYAGGHVQNPTYKQVCTGNTGHAEVVQIQYNPTIITFKDLLNVFFTIHDPTTLNRQGADIGTQYRSVIFYHNETQRKIAESSIKELEQKNLWENPIVTEISPFQMFFRAEDYHQDYYLNNANQPYCQVVIAPKISKFRKKFLDQLR
ncbi:MAG: peptide-methionine (S)-S-oxide reductase MsrA [Anaerolineales bacterium]|jgi:peptide-methionine (S)-S-oxide reductase